jgi:peptide/nickel transport system permease protein
MGKSFWLLYRRDIAAVIGTVFLLLLVFMAIAGPFLIKASPTQQDLKLRRAPVSVEHIFGRDQFGRDVFARIVFGARITILSGVAAMVIGVTGGSLAGIISGYFGRWIDAAIMRVVDLMLAFPFFLVAILIVAILGPGLRNAVIAVGIAKIPIFARFVRGLTLKAREEGYTEAARAIGSSDMRIMFLHIMPNIVIPVLVLATVEVASTILSVSGLSFLGLGAQPPASEWGLMLSEARGDFRLAPHIMIFPGIFLSLLVLAINMVGDGLQFASDPRRRGT